MARFRTFGPQAEYEKDARDLHRDTRSLFTRLREFTSGGKVAGVTLGLGAACVVAIPATVEFITPTGLFYALWVLTRPVRLPMRLPMRSGLKDRGDLDPATRKPRRAEGVDYLGTEIRTGKQLWHGREDIGQHTFVPGTTGSGKTQALISLAVVNALVQGSGCVFVDGKGDNKLYTDILALARRYGREDDILVLNFLTLSGRDSNTVNPFASATSDMIRELLVGQLNSPGSEGNGGIFFDRAVAFLGMIAPILTWLRDNKGVKLDLERVRDATELSNVVLLATKRQIKFVDTNTGVAEVLDCPDMPMALVQPLRTYLGQTGGFDLDVDIDKQRSDEPAKQHSFITMQFTGVFTQWLVSLAHVFRTRTGDIDMLDVVLNRRILVVLLPALENSEKTTSSLGKIVVAMLKAMMALTLPSKLEGQYAEIVENRPSEAPSHFKIALDEVVYYVANGMDVMLAQGRSLLMHFLLGAQEIAGLKARIGGKIDSLLGNMNLQVIMRLQDGNDTKKYVEGTAGDTHVTQSTSFNAASDFSDVHVASRHAEVRQVSRVSWLDVRNLLPGEAILLFQNTRVYAKLLYAKIKQDGIVRRNRPQMMVAPHEEGLRDYVSRVAALRKALAEGIGRAEDPEEDTSPTLHQIMRTYGESLAAGRGAVLSALDAALSCPEGDGPLEIFQPDPEPVLAVADEEETTPDKTGGHVFSDMLRTAVDGPTAPMGKAPKVLNADGDVVKSLTTIERAGGLTVADAGKAAHVAVDQMVAAARAPEQMSLPVVGPEKLATLIDNFIRRLDQAGVRQTQTPSVGPS